MYKTLIEEQLGEVISKLGFPKVDIVCSIPENSQFGDYSTNVALQVSKLKGKNVYHSTPEIANHIIETLGHPHFLERVEVAGPGFINFFLKDESLISVLANPIEKKPLNKKTAKRVIVEYADPNTHKDFHIGHIRPLVFGESVARLFEYLGAEVFRANYGTDIGPTVAKTIWGLKTLDDEYKKIKKEGSLRDKAAFLGKAYAVGHKAYEEDERAKQEIQSLTLKMYARDPEILPIWDETKNWSLGYFETIYSRFGVEFDRRINESEVDEEGKRIVEENIGTVFVKENDAIIFPGEKYGLHTRVFITNAGNPTYEAKELGLTRKYEEIFPFDELVITTDSQQIGFFEVTIKAMELIDSHLVGKKKHIPFGSINLTTGKMSSRSGNIISAEELIDKTTEAMEAEYGKADPQLVIGAVKFAILKYSFQTDITYDPKTSVSLHGDSGPYVMYTYVRTRSLLEKAPDQVPFKKIPQILEKEERDVLSQIEYFESLSFDAAKNLQPSMICEYLLNLSKAFNAFYEKYPILKSEKEVLRLGIVAKVGEVLKEGLFLLGITPPERM